ncbi:metal ABC transporter ATP-binding protein [Marinobacter oulmenensis]|uniref:Zinc transport system ATP-binding protein n=1 Tax=Marinobacter oulmenensis TaxID=643747 RepID=A0A840UCF9_9GAMM|nr:metal ABC transporter ATP-binding protein [Marinobacter oulmenensis]MBB5320970.1 zinc transport system ATP-binding protein [Marinobacter oulmenensis]
MALIAARNLTIGFAGQPLLEQVNLDIRRGEILALLGPNGSGKTSLLRTLIGALPPSSGCISRQSGLVTGYVPQRLHIDETLPMTVNRFLQLPNRHPREKLQQALDQAGAPALGARQLSTLSGGQFQRVLLARAILEKPDLLLLDEASQGLDYAGIRQFYRQLEQIQQALDCAIVIVSHDLNLVMQSATRVACLSGTIVCQGSPDTVAGMAEYQSLFGLDSPSGHPATAGVYPIHPNCREA